MSTKSNPNSCPNTQHLQAWSWGGLSNETAEQIETHLEHCPSCATQLATLDAASEPLHRNLERLRGLPRLTPEPAEQRLLTWFGELFGTSSIDAEATESIEVAKNRFGKFVILNQLGEGTFGTVHRALDTASRTLVALKRLKLTGQDAELLKDSESRTARFRRETEASQRLQHPNVVRCLEVGTNKGIPYLALELLEGETLKQRVVRRGCLPTNEACRLLGEAALGVEYIHSQGLIHRDIKPSNIMDDELGVKVLDLGLVLSLSADQEQLTATGVTMGTFDFMSPEQAERPHEVDCRADVYSLGATLYFLLTGQVPYADATTTHAKLLALADPTKHPKPLREWRPDVPQELADVVAAMMHKDPDKRLQSAAVAHSALMPFMGLDNTVVVPRTNEKKQPSRSWLRVALGTMLSLALVAIVVIIVRNKKGEPIAEIKIKDDLVENGSVTVQDTKTGKETKIAIPPQKEEECAPLRFDGKIQPGDCVVVKIQNKAYETSEGKEGLNPVIARDGWKGKVLEVPEFNDLCKVEFTDPMLPKAVWVRADCLRQR